MRPTIDRHLAALVAPASVAIVGASDNATKLTSRPMRFMRQHGFAGRVYPVNPVRETVLGAKAWPSVASIPEPVDHTYILVDAEPAMKAFEDCIRAGVKVVSVLADGFAEAGEAGRERQARLAAMADEAGILLIGPNSTGVVGTKARFLGTTNAAFAAPELLVGRLAVLSQSGSVIGTMLSRGAARGIGFSSLVSVGNEAQSGIGELGELLVDDPDTDAFVLFMETIRNRDTLASFARRAAEVGKPVVAYMIGRSDEGKALSVSHTGALTGASAAIDAYLRDIGILRVETFETLLEAPLALHAARLPPSRPRTVTVVSTTGGGGAMVVDQIAARGGTIAGLSPFARAPLEALGIPLGHGKLVDVTLAGARYDAMKAVVSTIAADPATGLLLVAIGSSAQFDPDLSVKPIVDAVAEAPAGAAPVLAIPLPNAEASMRLLANGGVPTFRTVESCAEAVAALLRAPLITSQDRSAPREASCTLPIAAQAAIVATPVGVLDEARAGDILTALGLNRPRQVVLPPGRDPPGELPFPFPVVAKLVSADIPHKTEAGAVMVGIGNRDDLVTAIETMRRSAAAHVPGARIDGVLVQEMCRGLGEALIGLTRDPLVGPVVTVAMGGVLAEIYQDAAVRPAPVTLEAAREMIAEVKGFAILRGYRGKPKGDLEALSRTLALFSCLALSEDVAEAEVNPILVRGVGEGVVALDALLRIAR